MRCCTTCWEENNCLRFCRNLKRSEFQSTDGSPLPDSSLCHWLVSTLSLCFSVTLIRPFSLAIPHRGAGLQVGIWRNKGSFFCCFGALVTSSSLGKEGCGGAGSLDLKLAQGPTGRTTLLRPRLFGTIVLPHCVAWHLLSPFFWKALCFRLKEQPHCWPWTSCTDYAQNQAPRLAVTPAQYERVYL